MKTEIYLPKFGFTMEEGNLVQWLCEDGAVVTEGSPLYLLEADKSAQEVEAPASGTLRILAQSDAIYPIGTVLGEIEG